MTKTFEELLDGRKLHQLTDEEIDEIISQMTSKQVQQFEKELKKQGQKKKAPSKKKKQNEEDFEKALFGTND